MDGNLIIVEVLINGVLFKPVLIDISCECTISLWIRTLLWNYGSRA